VEVLVLLKEELDGEVLRVGVEVRLDIDEVLQNRLVAVLDIKS